MLNLSKKPALWRLERIQEIKMIDYSPFWKTLEQSEENWYTLTKKHRVSDSTLHRLKHNTCPDTSLQNYELLFNEYIEICESSGWKHIVEDSEYQIFFTEDTNTVDIQTDDSLKLDSLLKINSGYLLQMLSFFFLAMTWGKNNPTIESYSYGKLCMTIFYSSITFFFGLNFLEDLLWKLNAKKSLKEGNIVKYPGLSSFKIKLLIQKYNSVAIIILLVGIFILQNENQVIYLILAFSIGFIILTIMLLVNIIKNHS